MLKSISVSFFLLKSIILFPILAFSAQKASFGLAGQEVDTLKVSLPSPPSKVNLIAIPDSWTSRYQNELLRLNFGLKKNNGSASVGFWKDALKNKNQQVIFLGETFPADSALANQKFIPIGSKGNWIYLNSQNDSTKQVYFFYKTGNPFNPSSFFQEVGIQSEEIAYSLEPYEFNWKKSYSFREIDFPNILLNSDQPVYNATFPTYLTKGFYKNWTVDIHFKVNNPKNSDYYLKILVNNNLIRSYEINQGGTYETSKQIPPMPLSVGSYFTLSLVNENGKQPTEDVSVEVDLEKSQLSPTFRNDFPMTFSSFPKNMEGKPLKILIDYDLRPSELEALTDLIVLLNKRPDKAYPFYLPEIIRLKNPGDVPELNSNLILITQTPQAYTSLIKNHSKLKYTAAGKEYQSDELDRFFAHHPSVIISSMELMALDDQKLLFIVNDPLEDRSMKEAVDGMEDEIISNTGNILLADATHYYFFDIRLKEPLGLGSQKKGQFEQVWLGYRIYITILLLAGLLLLLRYIYIKSQHAKKSIEDARN